MAPKKGGGRKAPARKGKGNWIKKATKNKGGLHRSLGIAQGKKIPKSQLSAKPGDSAKVKKQKALARTLGKMKKRR